MCLTKKTNTNQLIYLGLVLLGGLSCGGALLRRLSALLLELIERRAGDGALDALGLARLLLLHLLVRRALVVQAAVDRRPQAATRVTLALEGDCGCAPANATRAILRENCGQR